MSPLTRQESEIAERYFYIVERSMREYGIYNDDDCYDEAIWYFLQAIHRYCTDPTLQQYKIKTILYKGVEGGIRYYIQKQHKESKRHISFDEPVKGDKETSHRTYADIIAAPNTGYEQEDEQERPKTEIVKVLKSILSNRQFQVLYCSAVYGLAYPEIAAELGIKKSTVGTTMAAIRAKIKMAQLDYTALFVA